MRARQQLPLLARGGPFLVMASHPWFAGALIEIVEWKQREIRRIQIALALYVTGQSAAELAETPQPCWKEVSPGTEELLPTTLELLGAPLVCTRFCRLCSWPMTSQHLQARWVMIATAPYVTATLTSSIYVDSPCSTT